VVARPKHGEIWWYEPPGLKRRPYLILTRTEALGHLNRLLAVPATRTVRDIPTEVYVDRSDGMPGPSVLSLDNLALAYRAYFTTKIATLERAKMLEVCEALRFAVAC
jgi:mRNA interferase MazF